MRLYTILHRLIVRAAQVSITTFHNVPDSYASSNLIFWDGTRLTPSRFPDSAFFVTMTSPNGRNESSLYIVLTGTEDANDQINALIMSNTQNGPRLIKTNSGGIAPMWPSGSGITDDITVALFKVK